METKKMNVEERLKKADEALSKMGVVDKKFFFAARSESLPSKVYEDVADMEEAYLNGKYKPLDLSGDRGTRKPIA